MYEKETSPNQFITLLMILIRIDINWVSSTIRIIGIRRGEELNLGIVLR